ncbi:DUF1109 domain-containing protein [Ancylobacter sp. WKF20]|uniref:DUF1109 domain-containing protein n=1 Tax=Ancylobacter sp. WKF20 TaxID=3039801 RepID=UPI0024345F86|nr:DUF1109 domain-containing protein [Ancylobacter sp. WKF20]WGD29791.1 DUF1109 domain-containing protein [Ancylobacter sp. WKF20]
MKTDELISLLAQDAPVRGRLGAVLALALAGGAAAALALLGGTIGLRPDLASALETSRVLFKISFTLLLAVLAGWVLFRVGRPGLKLRPRLRLLFLPLGLLLLAVSAELVALPRARWMEGLEGLHASFCLVFIPLVSVAPLVAILWALRASAPSDPGFAGAAAGLAAGAIGAAVYALHCPDDSPLFVATWYSLAILIVSAAGYVAGRRLLRW